MYATPLLPVSKQHPGVLPEGLLSDNSIKQCHHVVRNKVCVCVCVCVLPVLVGKEFEEAPQFLRHAGVTLHQRKRRQ